MIDDLEVLLKSAVCDVLRTMLNFDAHPVPLDKEIAKREAHVAGSVGFIGTMSGVVYIYTSATFAARMTSLLLGLAEQESPSDELVNDAMGELANMTVGNFKSALVERGHSCVLTIPSIVRGSQFSVETTSRTTRRVLCFRCNDSQRLLVELLLRTSA